MQGGDSAQPVRTYRPLTPDAAGPAARGAISYTSERFDGSTAVLACLAEHEGVCSTLAFQRLAWLRPLYETLAAGLGAHAVAISIMNARTGGLAAVLPLVISREGKRQVVSWASLGVSDYGGPLLGPTAPSNPRDAAALWAEVKRALDDCDLIDLANMPRKIDGRINPFVLLNACLPSRHHGHQLTLETTVDAFLAARGKKYRKEAERCTRLLAEMGAPEFARAGTSAEIAAAYETLQTQQRNRHTSLGSDYRLGETAYAQFFEDALHAGAPGHTAHLFTLKAGGETGAVLYGISDATTFTLLRISTGGAAWKRVSPGRLIVLETMRYFQVRGIMTFDMGIGDYEFKHGFGVKAQPLADAIAALSVRGLPRVASARAKAKARQYPGLVDAAKRLLGRA